MKIWDGRMQSDFSILWCFHHCIERILCGVAQHNAYIVSVSSPSIQSCFDPIYVAANHMFDDYRISVTWAHNASIEISLQYSNFVKQTIRSKFRYFVSFISFNLYCFLFLSVETTFSTRFKR